MHFVFCCMIYWMYDIGVTFLLGFLLSGVMLFSPQTDRYYCFISGNIHKTEDGLILHNICSSRMISMKFY